MLSLEINGIALDLPNEFSITLNLKSPIFNDIGDYSFPFKIPSTDRNKSILGWKDRIESTRNIWDVYPGTLSFDSLVIFSGLIKIKEANSVTYEGCLYVQNGSFNFKVKEAFLDEQPLGEMHWRGEIPALTYYNDVRNHSYPEVDFQMPECMNVDYFDPPVEDAGLFWYNDTGFNGHLNLLTPDNLKTLIVPMFYLRFVIKKVIELMGYSVDDEFFSKGKDLSTIVMYNSFSVNDLYWTMKDLYYSVHMPHVKIGKFFSDIQKFFNCTFLVDDQMKIIRIIGNQDCLRSLPYIEFSENVIALSNLITDQLMGIRLSMTPDSGDKVYQELTASEADFLDHLKPSVSTYKDLPLRPFTTLFDLRYVISEDKWYQFGTSGANTWLEVSPSTFLYINFMVGQPLDSSKTEIGICMVCPQDELRGRVGNLGTDYAKIVPKLAFAELRETASHGYKVSCYPYSDTLRLVWYGTNGLYNSFHKEWLEWFLNSRKYIQITKQMSYLELKDLDFGSKYRINGVNYLLSEVQVTFNKNSLKPSVIKAYTCL